MNRRDMVKGFGLAGAAGMLGFLRPTNDAAIAQTYSKATQGLPPLKITSIKAILTAPERIRLCVVKVETSEPGLYGLGCATFNQRPLTVATAVNEYLAPFAKGRDVDNIEDLWQNAYTSSYWRNGPVLNNALSGLDQALWDIKGKRLEPYHPFFIEDPFAPEDIGYFKMLRQQTSVPIAMGELFNSPHEWVGLISERLIDFIRVHISQIGGLSVARKIATLGEWFNVRSAWHGPGDVSPVGHAANAHLDLAIWNFGIQESVSFSDRTREVFPGCPTMENGYMRVNEAPGFGVDLNEELAARYPLPERPGYWDPVRRPDGTAVRP